MDTTASGRTKAGVGTWRIIGMIMDIVHKIHIAEQDQGGAFITGIRDRILLLLLLTVCFMLVPLSEPCSHSYLFVSWFGYFFFDTL